MSGIDQKQLAIGFEKVVIFYIASDVSICITTLYVIKQEESRAAADRHFFDFFCLKNRSGEVLSR